MNTFELILNHIGDSDSELKALVETAKFSYASALKKISKMQNRILEARLCGCREFLELWRDELRIMRGDEADELAGLLADIDTDNKSTHEIETQACRILDDYQAENINLPGWIPRQALKVASQKTEDPLLKEVLLDVRSYM